MNNNDDTNQSRGAAGLSSCSVGLYNKGGHVNQSYHGSTINIGGPPHINQPIGNEFTNVHNAAAPSEIPPLTSSDLASQNATPRAIQTTTESVVANDGGVVNIHNYPPHPRQSPTYANKGSTQLPAPTASSTGIGIHNEGNMTQHNHNCTTNIYGGPPPAKAPKIDMGDRIATLLNIIHQNAWEKTHINIGDSFKADKFPDIDFEVHPQMAESPCFYQGGHAVVENDSSLPINKRRRVSVKGPKYKKDYRFTFTKANEKGQRSLSDESLVKKIREKKDKLGVIGVVAPAGAGKTTCMCRWTRSTMEHSGITKINGFATRQGNWFQMVHFMDMKGIYATESMYLQEFLFKGLFENENDMKIAYNWLLKNQNQVVIFLDGLDQAQQKIANQDVKAVGNYDKANFSAILCNLLTRNLLPGVRIIISSREHAAASLPEQAWFHDVITLTGFSEDDAKKLFNALTTGDDAANDSISEVEVAECLSNPSATNSFQLVKSNSSTTTDLEKTVSVKDNIQTNWDKLTKTSSSLLSFVSVPVFLMFTAIVFNTFGQTPSSITELLVQVFETLPCSIVIQKRKTIWTLIHKLKKLSHNGMEKGFVIFSSEDLSSHELSVDDIQDLLLMVPRSRSLSHRLIEGDNVFFFCHQILQEFLSACFIVEMTLENFKIFVETHLNEGHWSVVRRFVCGLLFSVSEKLENLLQIEDKEQKQNILRESLAKQLHTSGNDNLELYAAFYESNDDNLIHSITDVTIGDGPLIRDGAHLIGSLLARCGTLKSLQLCYCELDDDNWQIITDRIKESEVKIDTFIFNEAYGFCGSAALNSFLRHINSEVIDLVDPPRVLDGFTDDWMDWSNIHDLCVRDSCFSGHDIYLVNEKDSVTLTFCHETSVTFRGTFSKKGEHLDVDAEDEAECCYLLLHIAMAQHFCVPLCSVTLTVARNPCSQYVHYADVGLMKDWNVTAEVRSIVLDYFASDNRDGGSYISDFADEGDNIISMVQNFKVCRIDLAIHPTGIENILSAFRPEQFQLWIHVCQKVERVDDLEKYLFHLKGKEVESLRMILEFKECSYAALESLINNMETINVKQLYIVHDDESSLNSLRLRDYYALRNVALSYGVALTFVQHTGCKCDDPWSILYARAFDERFYGFQLLDCIQGQKRRLRYQYG